MRIKQSDLFISIYNFGSISVSQPTIENFTDDNDTPETTKHISRLDKNNSIKKINTMTENFQIIPRCEIYKALNVSSLNSDMMYFEESVNKKIDALSPENYAVIASMIKEKI